MPYASEIRKTANVVSPAKHACTVDHDSGVPLREGRGAVGGQETDGLVVSVAGRLIAGGQPVGVASVTARKEAQRWPGVAVACQRSRRCRPGDEAGGRGCEQRNER